MPLADCRSTCALPARCGHQGTPVSGSCLHPAHPYPLTLSLPAAPPPASPCATTWASPSSPTAPWRWACSQVGAAGLAGGGGGTRPKEVPCDVSKLREPASATRGSEVSACCTLWHLLMLGCWSGVVPNHGVRPKSSHVPAHRRMCMPTARHGVGPAARGRGTIGPATRRRGTHCRSFTYFPFARRRQNPYRSCAAALLRLPSNPSTPPCPRHSSLGPFPTPSGKYSLDEGGSLPAGPRGALFRQLLPEVAPLVELVGEVASERNKTPAQVGACTCLRLHLRLRLQLLN